MMRQVRVREAISEANTMTTVAGEADPIQPFQP